MEPPRLEHLFTVSIDPGERQYIGKGPGGLRFVHHIAGGSFDGPELRGKVLPGGADWMRVRNDDVCEVDVRLTLQTHDDKLIYMSYAGHMTNVAEVNSTLTEGKTPEPGSFYFFTRPRFETGAEDYAWLSTLVTIARGHPLPNGVEYEVFSVH